MAGVGERGRPAGYLRERTEQLLAIARSAGTVRPELDQYAAWERAAGNKAVSTWLAELADRASGWRG